MKNLYYCLDCFAKIPKDSILKEGQVYRLRQPTKCYICHKTFNRPIKLMKFSKDSIRQDYFRKCLTCGFEAKTLDDLKLFKPRKGKYFAYGVDAICLNCHTAKNIEYMKRQREVNPQKSREAVMKNYYKDPSKQRARDYSWRFIQPDTKCAACGATGVPLQKHHPDYSQWDLVITLCRKCHAKLRKTPKKIKPKFSLCSQCQNKTYPPGYVITWRCLGHNADVSPIRERWFTCSTFKPINTIRNGVQST
jgi:hypothetical protein